MPVTAHFDKARARTGGRALHKALPAAAEVIEAGSNRRIPTLSGEMERSSRVTVDGDAAAIAYTHPGSAVQHERMDYHHDDGQAKFLETALNQDGSAAIDVLADAVRAALDD